MFFIILFTFLLSSTFCCAHTPYFLPIDEKGATLTVSNKSYAIFQNINSSSADRYDFYVDVPKLNTVPFWFMQPVSEKEKNLSFYSLFVPKNPTQNITRDTYETLKYNSIKSGDDSESWYSEPHFIDRESMPEFVQSQISEKVRVGILFHANNNSARIRPEPITPFPARYIGMVQITFNISEYWSFFVYLDNATLSENKIGDFNYGLGVSSPEMFTVIEWVTMPFSLFRVYLWQRQSILILFGTVPFASAAFLISLWYYVYKNTNLYSLNIFSLFVLISVYFFMFSVWMDVYQSLFTIYYMEKAYPGYESSIYGISIFRTLIPTLSSLLILNQANKIRNNTIQLNIYRRIIGVFLAIIHCAIFNGVLIGPIGLILAMLIPKSLSIENKKIMSIMIS